jgi:hypothetical protein
MSDEKNRNENEDLTDFEAALAALRPRADGLDRRWRLLLAKEALLTAEILSERAAELSPLPTNRPCSAWCPSVPGEGQGEGSGEGSGIREREAPPPCVNPAGHRFFCIHCGSDLPTARRVRRWTWHAATAAMTSVAAMLLVMLIARPEPEMLLRVAKENGPSLGSPSVGVIQERAKPASAETGGVSEDWLAMKNLSRPRHVPGTDNMPYLTLRDQVLAYGLKSWQVPVSDIGITQAMEAPLPYREQLNRLLEQQGLSGS